MRPAALAIAISLTAIQAGFLPALSQDGSPDDAQAIASCLADSGRVGQGCIGSLALICARRDGNGPDANIACNDKERRVWAERAKVSLDAAREAFTPAQAKALVAFDDNGQAYRAAKCGLVSELAHPERRDVMKSSCELRETAMHALEIDRSIRRAERAERQASDEPQKPGED